MAITRLGAFTPVSGFFSMPSQFTVPAAGIPVGARIILWGSFIDPLYMGDTKGNRWTKRTLVAIDVADCLVTTALVSGDKIKMYAEDTVASAAWWYIGFWQTTSYFEASAHGVGQASWSGTAAVSPTVTTLFAGDLILGFFKAERGTAGSPALTAAGAGYTNEVGVNSSYVANDYWVGADWVSKIGSAPGPETPSGTMNMTTTWNNAATFVYTEAPLNQMQGVV